MPGLLPKDDILSLLKTMTSKNPSSEIAAQILLDGGYDPCLKFDDNDPFWTNHIGCDDGFIPDYKNGYCYLLLPSKKNLQDGIDSCADNYDAELILFEKNAQVDGFLTLMNKGIKAKFRSGMLKW